MPKETKEINVGLYGGKGIFGGREKPLEASVISCDMYDVCSYYQSGQCLNVRGFLNGRCENGSVRTVKGYTTRAQKYHTFKNKWQGHEAYNKLEEASKKLGLIGDVVVFPYSYVEIEEDKDTGDLRVTDPSGSWGRSNVFIDLDKFTPDFIYKICTFRPRAVFGGYIDSYQKEEVPLFLSHLFEVLPDLYKEFITAYPEFDKEIDYVGRKALLRTLNPSEVKHYGSTSSRFNEVWYWDGELLTYTSGYVSGFSVTKGYDIEEIKIRPKEDAVVEITDNTQVSSETIFVD